MQPQNDRDVIKLADDALGRSQKLIQQIKEMQVGVLQFMLQWFDKSPEKCLEKLSALNDFLPLANQSPVLLDHAIDLLASSGFTEMASRILQQVKSAYDGEEAECVLVRETTRPEDYTAVYVFQRLREKGDECTLKGIAAELISRLPTIKRELEVERMLVFFAQAQKIMKYESALPAFKGAEELRYCVEKIALRRREVSKGTRNDFMKALWDEIRRERQREEEQRRLQQAQRRDLLGSLKAQKENVEPKKVFESARQELDALLKDGEAEVSASNQSKEELRRRQDSVLRLQKTLQKPTRQPKLDLLPRPAISRNDSFETASNCSFQGDRAPLKLQRAGTQILCFSQDELLFQCAISRKDIAFEDETATVVFGASRVRYTDRNKYQTQKLILENILLEADLELTV